MWMASLKEEIEIYVLFSAPAARVPVNPKTYLHYCTVRAWQPCFRRIERKQELKSNDPVASVVLASS